MFLWPLARCIVVTVWPLGPLIGSLHRYRKRESESKKGTKEKESEEGMRGEERGSRRKEEFPWTSSERGMRKEEGRKREREAEENGSRKAVSASGRLGRWDRRSEKDYRSVLEGEENKRGREKEGGRKIQKARGEERKERERMGRRVERERYR